MNTIISLGARMPLVSALSRQSAARLGAFLLAAVLGTANVKTANGSLLINDVERHVFLAAIAEVETGGDPRAVGSQGERGPYQFRSGVWKQHTDRSFFQAHNPDIAYLVAVSHFDWLYEGFIRNGRRPTVYMMAAAWNGGLNRTLSGRLSPGTRSYAERVTNIVAVSQVQPVQVAWADAPRFHIRTAID